MAISTPPRLAKAFTAFSVPFRCFVCVGVVVWMTKDELRDDLIDALMVAEDYSFEAAERIVAEFERAVIRCPRCGAEWDESPSEELAGTIWA